MPANENATIEDLGDNSQSQDETRPIQRSSLGQDQLCASREREQRSTPTPSTWTLFEEPYWLDCVAPGDWEAIEITREGRVVARLPYILRKRYGLTAVTLPVLTPWLGPWISPCNGKYAKELSNQHELLRELVRQLPKAPRAYIACAPEYTNLHALHSEGWSLGLKYTYRLDCSSNLDLLWDGLSAPVRGRCRKAEKTLEIVTGPDQLPNLFQCLSKTFERQNLRHSLCQYYAALERVDSSFGARGQRVILTAIDARGRPHASLLIVFDERHAFVIVRGSDEKLRKSGGDSLLMWEAIRFASTRSLSFDFCGSMIPGIETFTRKFGPRQCPVYVAVKQSPLFATLEVLAGGLGLGR